MNEIPSFLYIYLKKSVVEYQKWHFVTISEKLFENHCSEFSFLCPVRISEKVLGFIKRMSCMCLLT